jgi:hypothetical protein
VKKIAFVVFLLGAWHAAAAAAALTPAQQSAICGARTTCTIGKSYEGGGALAVVEIHLGLKDKPDDAPDDGCHAADSDKRDGGAEYWLLAGGAKPARLLKFCNDGYGAANVGEDKVDVGPNRLVHWRDGGSSWRWESTVTYTLAPWRAAGKRDCSYNDMSADNGTLTDIDYVAMRSRSVAKDSAPASGHNGGDDVGCPPWPADAAQHFTPQPGPGLLGAYDILVPNLASASGVPPVIPAGTTIGDCGAAMSTAGMNGFVVFGKAAAADKAAEIRAIALSMNALLIQVYDPLAVSNNGVAPRSWIDLPHVEIWIGHDIDPGHTRLPVSKLSQVAVDLSGGVHAGVGQQGKPPNVEHWQARDTNNRPVTVLLLKWASDTAFLGGVGVVYSQAERGRQARLVANTGIVNNRPLYLPDIISLPNGDVEPPPGRCNIQNGRLSLIDAQ